MRTGGVDEAVAALSGTLGIAPHDTIDSVEAEFFAGSLIASSEWSAIAAALGAGKQERLRAGPQVRRARRAVRLGTRRNLSRDFLHRSGHPAPIDRYPGDQGRRAGRTAVRRAGARPCRPRPAQCRCLPRPQRGAAHRRLRGAGALPRRKGAARSRRLRRPDRQDAGAARQRRRRLGPLQARPRHRPPADRRGAGYERQAVGDHPAPRRRIHRRQGRPRAQAHDLRRRRREAVDLLLSGRGAQGVRADAALFRRRAQGRRIGFSVPQVRAFVPFRRQRARRRR